MTTRSRFYYRDPYAPEPNHPRTLSVTRYQLFGTFSDPTRIVSYPDGNVFRVASLAYSVEVDSFDGLRTSPESEELRFLPARDLLALDMPATQRPIIERLLSGQPPPHLE